jgi:Tol biopolymer transport system component
MVAILLVVVSPNMEPNANAAVPHVVTSRTAIARQSADAKPHNASRRSSPIHTAAGPKTYGASAITFCGISAQYIDIWSMGVDGSNAQPYVGGACDGAWAPDGSKFAWIYAATNGVYVYSGLFIQNRDGGGRTYLDVADRPAWSPDSKQLAAITSAGISVWNADGSHRRNVPTGQVVMADDGIGWVSASRIAFVGGRRDGQMGGIYTVSTAGGAPSLIPGSDSLNPAWVGASPDGRRIAFWGHTGPAGGPVSKWGPWRIYVMSSRGGTARTLSTTVGGYGNELSWSPDGKSIIYSGGPCGKAWTEPDCLDIVSATGGKPVRVGGPGFPVNTNPQDPAFEPALGHTISGRVTFEGTKDVPAPRGYT